MNNNQRSKQSGAVVAAAFVGAFASRWVDKSLSLKFPWDLASLVLSGLIFFYIVYRVSGDLISSS